MLARGGSVVGWTWRDAWFSYASAWLVGLLVAASIFPAAALDGTLSLTHPVSGDTAQHIIGQRYFLADAWRWPPFVTRLIEPPGGVNVALTDSIPLAALLTKPWFRWLPRGAHVVYLWVALCYVLQPVAAVFALRSAGERRPVPNLAIALFAISMPAFIFRFGHAALCAHFLLLLALGVYFNLARRPAGRWWLACPCLLLAGLTVHPYFVPMVAGLLAAAPLSLLARGQLRAAWRVALQLAGSVALLGLGMVAGGYLGADTASGFGYYSLNLLAPFTPSGSALIAGYPIMDATGGQTEGYSYLGLGLAGLAVLALAQFGRSPARAALWRHAGLALVAAGALLFAVSDQVYLGHHLLLHLPIVPRVLRQFRASGRFVWIDLYVLMLGATLLVCRWLSPRVAFPSIALLAAIQFADAGSLRGQVAAQMAVASPWAADPAQFRPLLARHQALTLWPTASCDPELVTDPLFMHLLLLASERALPVNTIPVARTSGSKGCGTANVTRTLLPGELRLLLPGTPANLVAYLPDWRRQCHHLPPGLIACSDDPALADLPGVDVAAFPTGQTLTLADAAGASVRGQGWTAAAPAGAWTIGTQASLLGTVAPAPGPLRLTMVAHGLAPAGQAQQVRVSANGREVATWQVALDADHSYQATLPPGTAAGGIIAIGLAIADPVRPQDVMGNGDVRPLGFFLVSFRLDQQ